LQKSMIEGYVLFFHHWKLVLFAYFHNTHDTFSVFLRIFWSSLISYHVVMELLGISPKNLFVALPRRLWLLLGFFLLDSTDTIGSPYIEIPDLTLKK
jgi:hypothetical protein